MRIHRVLVYGVVDILMSIFNEGKYADKAIEKVFQHNKKWGSRDRAFIAEQVYEIVRWWRLLHYGLTDQFDQTYNNHAKYWLNIVATNLIKNDKFQNPEWEEWNNLPKIEEIRTRLFNPNLPLEISTSIPDWLNHEGNKQLADQWEDIIKSMNMPAPLILRSNALKIKINELILALKKINIECSKVGSRYPDAIKVHQRTNVFSTDLFRNGFFEVQDAASQLVAQQMDLQPSMRVVDACAGAGGKTLHISAMMQNKGQIIALDKEEYKLNELKKRAIRAGANNIIIKPIENAKTIKRLYDSADRLLLDVPCSGLGVLRRNPDAKWKLKPEFIDNIRITQADILQNYSKILKNGGKMVYATCSIMPSENEIQVQQFLTTNPNFNLLDEIKTDPLIDDLDGFYMATLIRND